MYILDYIPSVRKVREWQDPVYYTHLAPIDTWSTADINVCRFDGTKKDEEIGRGCPGGTFWFPAETDMGNRKPQAAGSGWGWAPGEEHLCWTAEELLERYFTSVGRNSNFLLGECINDEGFFPDSLQFRKFGEKIREIYRKKVAETAGEGPVSHVVVPTDAVCRDVYKRQVVEGVGDHGCEYMTGGRVVVLGSTGKNFAAGMSGGIAYVLDEGNDLYIRLNKEMVSSHELTSKYDVQELKEMIQEHVACTNSVKGKKILDNFEEYIPKFKKIIPHDYERMMSTIVAMEEKGLSPEAAQIEAFYANTRK